MFEKPWLSVRPLTLSSTCSRMLSEKKKKKDYSNDFFRHCTPAVIEYRSQVCPDTHLNSTPQSF